MKYLGRFDECRQCVWFKNNRPTARCLKCTAGEFFEERVDDGELGDNELMDYYKDMDDDD